MSQVDGGSQLHIDGSGPAPVNDNDQADVDDGPDVTNNGQVPANSNNQAPPANVDEKTDTNP